MSGLGLRRIRCGLPTNCPELVRNSPSKNRSGIMLYSSGGVITQQAEDKVRDASRTYRFGQVGGLLGGCTGRVCSGRVLCHTHVHALHKEDDAASGGVETIGIEAGVQRARTNDKSRTQKRSLWGLRFSRSKIYREIPANSGNQEHRQRTGCALAWLASASE